MNEDAVAESESGRRLEREVRLKQIVAELEANPGMKLVSLADAFNVSTETIRRDLNKLTRQGLINRTYGGATIVPSGIDRPFPERIAVHREERVAIARRAVKLVEPGEVLALAPGSRRCNSPGASLSKRERSRSSRMICASRRPSAHPNTAG